MLGTTCKVPPIALALSREEAAAAQRDAQAASCALAAAEAQHAVRREGAGAMSARVEQLRAELVRCTAQGLRLRQAAAAAAAGRAAHTQRLAAAEAALAVRGWLASLLGVGPADMSVIGWVVGGPKPWPLLRPQCACQRHAPTYLCPPAARLMAPLPWAPSASRPQEARGEAAQLRQELAAAADAPMSQLRREVEAEAQALMAALAGPCRVAGSEAGGSASCGGQGEQECARALHLLPLPLLVHMQVCDGHMEHPGWWPARVGC